MQQPNSAQTGELLYESATTRVTRSDPGAVSVVVKEFLGAHAASRWAIERAMLKRLEGIAGVSQLAAGPQRGNVLLLRDCAGVSIAQVMRRRLLDIQTVIVLAAQLARTLAAVHRAGVIHRDINPANILICDERDAVLIDFDISVPTDRPVAASQAAELVGTIEYIAPEQTGRTGRTADARVDLYSLGATLYEMATGRVPFEAQDALQAIHAHLVRDPVPPSVAHTRVPQGLSDIVMRLLAKAPEQRYENLESRVQARTRQLQETQAELVATARRAGKAEIANNVLHNVGNVLNSVVVSTSVVRRTIGESRTRGLARAVGVMVEHAHELTDFIATDPRGKALLPYLIGLADELDAERANALADLDRISSSVEHIGYLVQTQQSNAGPSSMLDIAKPEELIEEALRMSGEALRLGGVSVIRQYQDVPVAPLDKSRLLQILVNLISNAAQAMEGVPQESRFVTVVTDLVRGDAGDRVRITVRDQGRGIEPENLTRIFAHGFTGRKEGHGYGLHASAVAAVEMGARLTAHSEGPGQGAEFRVELPMPPAA